MLVEVFALFRGGQPVVAGIWGMGRWAKVPKTGKFMT